jgi:signal transduction histidine kinase
MSLNRILSLIILLGIALQQVCGSVDYEDWDLSALETRLSDLDAELERLPALAMRSDSGSIGYRSDSPVITDPDRTEWVQVNLKQAQTIDEIILVPIIRRDTQKGFQADGFPRAFHVLAGTGDDTEGHIVATYSAADQLLPRTAPLVIPCPNLRASWVRIVATELSARGWDHFYVLQLAEIMLVKDGRNLAFRQHITASSTSPGPAAKYSAHKQEYIVDGFVPYIMDDYKGEQSTAFFCDFPVESTPTLTLDLETPTQLSQINLHGMEVSDSVPQGNKDHFGMLKHLRIEAANQVDFSDATVLVDDESDSIYKSGPILQFQFPEAHYRYLRFKVLKPDITQSVTNTPRGILGIAEIEVYSGNTNVALGKAVGIDGEGISHPQHKNKNEPRNLEAITDGRNFYGDILPFDVWMRQLAKRHDLETERPQLVKAITQAYARQRANLRLMGYLAAALAVGILIVYLAGRMRAMRQITHIRKRFAADLHDELGANLHAIGLLSDLAHDAVDEKEKLQRIVSEVRAVTERTSNAVRYCANSQEARDPMGTLKQDMHRIVKRMMHDMDYQIEVEGETFLQKLKLRTRNDLFLFYKECLANISRHSGATQFSVHLAADARRAQLSIQDNGQGYIAKPGVDVPPSLKRRAQLMHAHLELTQPENGGTRITLTLKHRKFPFISQ